MSEEAPGVRWHRALLALRLLALDPGLGGIALRARAGPVRDRWMNALARFPLTVRKVPVTIGDDALFGGLDLAATLVTGREQRTAGLLSAPALLTIPMAERMEPGLAARLAGAIDGGAHSLIALDEGADEEEGIPDALADRLAFHVSLDGIPCGAAAEELGTLPPMAEVTASEADMAAIAELAETLGVSSTRAGLHCLRAARAHAALHRRGKVAPEDIEAAAILTLAPRATRMPAPSEDEAPAPEHAEDHPQQDDEEGGASIPQELLLDAVRSALPPGLLAQLAAGSARRGARGAGTGTKRKGNRKGRPLPPRAGRPDGRARIDLVATLRTAAPWQSIRKAGRPSARPVEIRASDIHLKRFEERSDRLLIFTVDASGSAALARLAEAKGAIELLLSEAYARRDHVALVAFRGISAEVLLPPTRSLVQTKRRLAALPGGGGTPLAAGLESALSLAISTRGKGMTPTLILLTDGRANVAIDGEADRARAAADAQRMARATLAQGIDALIIDTGKRPERALRTLAETMDATYLPLPRADAARLSDAVTGALG